MFLQDFFSSFRQDEDEWDQENQIFKKLCYKSESLDRQNNLEVCGDLMIVLIENKLYSFEEIQNELIDNLEEKKKVNNLELDDVIQQLRIFFQLLEIKQRKNKIPIYFIQQLVDSEKNLNQAINNLPYWQKTIIQIITQILLKQQDILKATNKEELKTLIFPTHEEYQKSRILVGPTIFGLQNGNFIYIIDGVQKQVILILCQGGEMRMGKKRGVWKEYGILDEDFQNETSLKIQFNQGMITYIKDGEILSQCNSIDHVLLKNIQQIKFQRWNGNYNNGKKSGKFQIIWKGENLNIGGEYNQKGEKFGSWTELFENYGDKSQVYYIGEYLDGKKYGSWSRQYDDGLNTITLPLGMYSEERLKDGVWLELHEKFWDNHQVFYTGQYNKGVKNGFWAMKQNLNNSKIIGGGFYNQKGMKSGEWNEKYFWDNLVIEVGDYENGRKIGNWFSKIEKLRTNIFALESQSSQLHFHGDYKDGVKVGLWDIFFQDDENYKLIGGGIYDDKGMKNGKWIEFDKNYKYSLGWLIQEWKEIWFLGRQNQTLYIINLYTFRFGGMYDSNGVKQGKWSLRNQLVTDPFCYDDYDQNGSYINGIKVGKYSDHFFNINFQGQYNDKGMRNGKWKEIKNKDNQKCKIIYEGEYDNGFQIGKWEIYDDNYDRLLQISQIIIAQRGGGTYIQEGIKDGMWIELHENFFYRVEVRYDGQYQSGIKIGDWIIKKKNMKKTNYKQIGGGQYNDQGMKIGYWEYLSKFYFWKNLIVGNYIQGKKIGIFKEEKARKLL
ncbi:unnamed protein product [Paramecium octaurelia]|uniref:Uncharacterized protein n=1 Tax=Paramecium octaurelia TaxID=43137 RepID=A0A8S1X365_PAROT|nr:unnamed protein product [Paramecium octaurelia]